MVTNRKNKLTGVVMAIRTFRHEDGIMDIEKQAFSLDWVDWRESLWEKAKK